MISAGVEATSIVAFLGICLGVLLVVEYQMWVGKFVERQVLSSIMIIVFVRELGPLLVNLVLIARSGSAMATELALLRVGGELRVLEGQGVPPLEYLVLPRVAGLVISAVCLTVIFVGIAFLGVYVCGQWVGTKTGSINEFLQGALSTLTSSDLLNLLLKCVIPAALTGTACCMEGLDSGPTFMEVPRASRIGVQRSVVMLFVTGAVISIATYL